MGEQRVDNLNKHKRNQSILSSLKTVKEDKAFNYRTI